MIPFRRLSLLLLLLAPACGPSDGDGPFRVAVLDLNEGATSWSLRPATIEADSLRQARGEAATMLGGARIVIDYPELEERILSGRVQSAEHVRDELVRREGRPPRIVFSRASVAGEADVLVPTDYHGLAIVSAYHQIQRSRSMALSIGMPPSCLRGLEAYYETSFTMSAFGYGEKITNNALFSPPVEAMMLVPYEMTALPLGMNPGVIGHEYGHGIWHCVVNGEEWPGQSAFLDGPSQRHLHAVEEGLADFFGALVSGEPNFMIASVASWDTRDLDRGWIYTAEMRADAQLGPHHDPYAAGTVVASALWEIGSLTGDMEQVGRAVGRSLEMLADVIADHVVTGRSADVITYLDVFVRAISEEAPSARATACSVLQERFQAAGTILECI